MREKGLIANALSISCVENYFLGWCAECNISKEVLFSKSYLSASEILNDFLTSGAKFEHYDKIPRVMRVAEVCCATKHIAVKELDFALIDKEICSGNLVLVEVGVRFFEHIAIRPWRNDHFIWLTGKIKGGYKYLNNYPLNEGVLSTSQIKENYNGKTLIYYAQEKLNTSIIEQNSAEQLRQMKNFQSEILKMPEKIDPFALRNAVGIIKITRLRIAKWLATIRRYEEACLVERYSAELSNIYIVLEAAILRKQFEATRALEKINKILEKENTLLQMIK